MTSSLRRFDYLSWPEAKVAADRDGSTLVWPFGACEQHGPHLPLATDSLFSEKIINAVLKKLPEGHPIWMIPTQVLGFSPEHASFPGTISLSSNLVIQLISEVGKQVASMGFRRLLLFNAHGGQIGLLEAAARELRINCPGMAVLPCFLWRGIPSLKELIPSDEIETGLHAGLAETSLMLSLSSELVGKQRPFDGSNCFPNADPPRGWSWEGASPCSWLTEDLSKSGVIGDSRASNEVLGGKIEECLVDHWVDLLEELMQSDWPPVTKLRIS